MTTEGDSDARAAREYEHARTLYVQTVETDGRLFPFQAASLRRSWRELARRRPDLVERMVGDWELWELLSGLGHEVLEVRDEAGTDVIAVSCDGDTLPPPAGGARVSTRKEDAPPPMDPVTVFLLAAGQACAALREKRNGRPPEAVADPFERAKLRKAVVQAMKEAMIIAPDQDDPAVHDLALNMIVSQMELLIAQAEIDAAAREAHEG